MSYSFDSLSQSGAFCNIDSLYARYNTRVVELCARYNSIYYEDWAQDIWVKIYQSDIDINWRLIYRISVNYCIDMLRRKKVRVNLFSIEYEKAPDLIELINLNVLNPREKRLYYYYLRGYRLKEIAKILDISYGTITPMFSKMVQKLRLDLVARNIIEPTHSCKRIYK